MCQDQILMSIVVPIYNAERYLSKCIDSLIINEYEERIEVILVDDGSTDRSGLIADSYSDKYSFIKVIHKENEGPSSARNSGLQQSSGKYVFFCDADDMVVSDSFTDVIKYTLNQDADVIIWDAVLMNEEGLILNRIDSKYFVQTGIIKDDGVISGLDYLTNRLKQYGDYATVVWLGAYRRSYLIDNGLYFENDIMHEDELWVPQVLIKARSVKYIPGVKYHYRIRNDSRNCPQKENLPLYIESVLIIYNTLYRFCDESIKNSNCKAAIKSNVSRKYLHRIFEYDFIRNGYGDRIDLNNLWNTSKRIRDKVRVIILFVRKHIRI